MVMPGDALGGDEAAHGKGVDQGVVEVLVLGDVGGGNVARFAHRLRLRPSVDRLRFGKRFCRLVHAETVFGTGADESLGVHSAVQMVVQVGALGHAHQEFTQSKRVFTHPLQLLRGALFGSCLCRRSLGRDLGESKCGNEAKKGKR
jgi:hypothetical protein